MRRGLLIWTLLAVVGTAQGIVVQGTPPAAPTSGTKQKFASIQSAAHQSDDSSGMRRGTIESLSLARGTFHVHGQALTFDAKRVKVFSRSGKPAGLANVRKGSAVRFTLDPTDPQHRRVAAIYVD